MRLFRRSLPANAQNHPTEINFVLLIYPFGYNIVAEMRQMIATDTSDGSSITLIAALIAGALICLEYLNTYPSMLKFRDAAPYNRIRYLSALIAIICVSTLFREAHHVDSSNKMLMAIGTIIGHGLDFPYSPIRLIILTLPLNVSDTRGPIKHWACTAYPIFDAHRNTSHNANAAIGTISIVPIGCLDHHHVGSVADIFSNERDRNVTHC